MRVLIIDDNKESLYLLDYLLQSKGYQVSKAANGKEALSFLQQEKVDLIITDILMPEMDGFQFCKLCKQDEKLKNIPLIFYTATYTDAKDEEFAKMIGGDLFLRKPLEPDEMLQQISSLLTNLPQSDIVASKPEKEAEAEILKLYNERLIKKLEKKILDLEHLEFKYQTICEHVNDLIFSLDAEGKFLMLNCRIDIFGYQVEDMKGKSILDILTPESNSLFQSFFQKCKDDEHFSNQKIELEFVNKDGGQTIGELNISVSRVNSQFRGFFGIIRDITQNRRQEKEYKQLIDGMNDTTFVISFQRRFLEVNRAALELFGYSREEFLALGPADIDSQLTAEVIKKLIDNMKADKLQVFETMHTKKDGSVFPVEISSSLVTYKGEKAILSVARDITGRKIIEKELQKHRENLEELIKERTCELEKKNQQLEEFNRLFVGREFRIKELRDRVKELEEKL